MALLPGTSGMAGPLCSDMLDLQVAEHGSDARVVTVGGEIDTLTAPELAVFLIAQLVAVPLVVLDLDGVQFLGSAGLSVLVKANELAAREGRHLRLVCHSGMINRALDVTGLREQFAFADTVSGALQNSP
jgi:anti-sigma B factor antagonist